TTDPRFKTKLCNKIREYGQCPYGVKCLFIHPEDENGPQDNKNVVKEAAMKELGEGEGADSDMS
uniref:C3H1-type domain-containing protein n=1 Tax=Steinernema glaseri TaxID=37863 RepID=A0A1I7Y1J2_9BILA